MKLINIVISFVFLSIFVCYSTKTDNYDCSNEEIRYFDKSRMITEHVESKSVSLHGDNTGMIAVQYANRPSTNVFIFFALNFSFISYFCLRKTTNHSVNEKNFISRIFCILFPF